MAEKENKPKVIVVMPAFNAAKTLRLTYDAIAKEDIDQVILVDDGSRDETLKIATELKLESLCPRAQLRLRWQSEDLLYGSVQGKCGR